MNRTGSGEGITGLGPLGKTVVSQMVSEVFNYPQDSVTRPSAEVKSKLTRRDFIKIGAFGIASLALASCTPAVSALAPTPTNTPKPADNPTITPKPTEALLNPEALCLTYGQNYIRATVLENQNVMKDLQSLGVDTNEILGVNMRLFTTNAAVPVSYSTTADKWWPIFISARNSKNEEVSLIVMRTIANPNVIYSAIGSYEENDYVFRTTKGNLVAKFTNILNPAKGPQKVLFFSQATGNVEDVLPEIANPEYVVTATRQPDATYSYMAAKVTDQTPKGTIKLANIPNPTPEEITADTLIPPSPDYRFLTKRLKADEKKQTIILVNAKEETVATYDQQAGGLRWEAKYYPDLDKFLTTDDGKKQLTAFFKDNPEIHLIVPSFQYDPATKTYSLPVVFLSADGKKTQTITAVGNVVDYYYDTTAKKMAVKISNGSSFNKKIFYYHLNADGSPDYSALVNQIPVNLPNPEDVRLVREDLKALLLEYPNMQSVTFTREFLDYWKRQYSNRVDFDEFWKKIAPVSFVDDLVQITGIDLQSPDKRTSVGPIALSTDGTVSSAPVHLNKDTLHPTGSKLPIVEAYIRRAALLKESVTALMCCKLYFVFNVSPQETDQFSQNLNGSMSENASSAVGYNFMRTHAKDIDGNNDSYNNQQEGFRLYMTNPKTLQY